jgi:hypothetical protein
LRCRSSITFCASSAAGALLPRFPFVRDLDGFDFAAQPSIDKKQIREIAAGRFIANAEAVLLLGRTAPAS